MTTHDHRGTSLAASAMATEAEAAPPPRSRLLGRLLARLPGHCDAGRLVIQLPSGEQLVRASNKEGPSARIVIHRWRALRRLLAGGHVGLAEAYMDGDCDCANLEALFAWAMANQRHLSSTWSGTMLSRLVSRLRHRRNSNTRRGSRRNIAAHYDLGNDFYRAWLDADMHYSSGIYDTGAETLEAAQAAKLDRIVELLRLEGGERVLEIGCGWGALSERLAARHGCQVTAITLSREQYDFARARMRRSGLEQAVDVRLEDYRAITGQFDRIVSIEMIEAVGQRFWPVYFDSLRHGLAPDGSVVLQAITIDEAMFPSYVAQPDFIQRYIFPGGMLPTRTILDQEATRAGLAIETAATFGQCYALTLHEWKKRFTAAWPRLAPQGFDERFRRMWQYYLDYCAVGFRRGDIDVGHYRLTHRGRA